jgi:pyruvate formate lyase activating enzyme
MKAHHALVADVIPFSWVDGPGNRFVLFLQGCNFNCLACHNPQTIPLQTPRATLYSVDEVLEKIRASMPYISGVTISGGEATLQHEFILELFSAIKSEPTINHLTTFIDSNGNAEGEVWRTLAPVTDGVMVDLKVLDDAKHLDLTGNSNAKVLESIKLLASMDRLFEVRLLLIPLQNDSDNDLISTAQYLLNIDPQIRVKINSFMTHGVRASAREWSAVTPENLQRYRELLLREGVKELV